MRNRGSEGAMVFEPSFVRAEVGDRIRFVPTDLGHNAETIAGILPVGTTPMKGALNKETILAVSKTGLYGIKCAPHFYMGMVALVQVGTSDLTQLKAARSFGLPPLARRRMDTNLSNVQ
jgi:pseudoazurin